MNNTVKRLVGASIIAATLVGTPVAQAKPHPYERKAVTAIKAKKAREGTLRNLSLKFNLPTHDARGKARDLHPYSKGQPKP